MSGLSKGLPIVLSILAVLTLSCPVNAAEADSVRNTPTLVVDFDTGFRILEDLEMCRIVREENTLYKQLDEIRKEREALLRERIGFLKEQNEELHRMNTAVLKIAKQAEPKWYEQIFTASKYIALGIILGFATGAAK